MKGIKPIARPHHEPAVEATVQYLNLDATAICCLKQASFSIISADESLLAVPALCIASLRPKVFSGLVRVVYSIIQCQWWVTSVLWATGVLTRVLNSPICGLGGRLPATLCRVCPG